MPMRQHKKKLDETDISSVAAYTANYSSLQSAKTAFENLDNTLQATVTALKKTRNRFWRSWMK